MSSLNADIDISRYLDDIDTIAPVEVRGRVTGLVGLIVKAAVPEVWVGELCLINSPHSAHPVKAEVVGFRDNEVMLMPLGDLHNIGMNCEVIPTGHALTVKVGDELLGRVLNGLGEPIDLQTRGPLHCTTEYSVQNDPSDPMKRERVLKPLEIGIRSIDGLLTVGQGQRIGIFAAA